MDAFFGIFVAVVILVAIFALKVLISFITSLQGAKQAQYEAVPILTATEGNFYRTLVQAVDRNIIVCPKVRLLDVIEPHSSLTGKDRNSARGRIQSKHVDFVLMRWESLSTYGVIELDDKSHEREDRVARDSFVNAALQGASIPILHIKPQRIYDVNSLRLQISAAFNPLPAYTPARGTPARYR